MATEHAAANRQFLKRILRLFETGNVSEVEALIDVNYVDHQGLRGIELTGIDGFREVLSAARAAVPDLHIDIQDLVTEGDRVVARLRWHGKDGAGRPVERETIEIIRIVDGRMAEHWGAHIGALATARDDSTQAAARSRQCPTDWYKHVFGEHYLRAYSRRLSAERTTGEVRGIVAFLGLSPGDSILDLCCGHGRHAIALAEQGYRVTGLDLSDVFLKRAEESAKARGVQVRWIHSDMREIPFEREFDAAINVFTSFGFLENEDEDEKVLRQVHRALNPGGQFLLQVINRDGAIRRFDPEAIERHDDGLRVLAERRFDVRTSRSEEHDTIIYPNGQKVEAFHAVRLYTARELARMLAAAGLRPERYFGDYDGSDLTLDSRRTIIVSRK